MRPALNHLPLSNMNEKKKSRRVQTCGTHLFLAVSLKLTKNKCPCVYSCSRKVLRWFNNLQNLTISLCLAQQETWTLVNIRNGSRIQRFEFFKAHSLLSLLQEII